MQWPTSQEGCRGQGAANEVRISDNAVMLSIPYFITIVECRQVLIIIIAKHM